MSKIKIQTAQNVEVSFTPASIGDRIIAHLIDLVVFMGWGLAFLLVAITFEGNIFNNNIGAILFFVLGVLPVFFYDLICEVYMNGQSIGKRVRHIRVIKLDGTPPSLGAYLLRWLFRLVDTKFPFLGPLVALITIAANGKGQRLGDIAAGTTVIKVKESVSLEALRQEKMDEAYEVMIPEASLLSDSDIEVVRDVLRKVDESYNEQLLVQTALKLKAVMQIQSELDDRAFLEQVLSDHTFLMAYGDE
ncbi:RDD family protein [Flectobacillus major]|uniref:RDD family protein n=1 Tax=Flectobacillus major TaxID=103 RepID=UPI000415394E|nr:RDD family protein [Flectobacillus major]